MATKKEIEIGKTIEISKEVTKQEVDTEKELLKKQIELMQKQLEAFNLKFEELKLEKTKEIIIESKEDTKEEYLSVNPNRRVKVMNMVHAPWTLENGRSSIRFDKFGDVRNIRYEDLEDFRYGKYVTRFEELELRILERDVVDNLNLDNFYDKIDITKEDMEKIMKLSSNLMMEKVSQLTNPLQISFASMFINGIVANKIECLDNTKWTLLGDYFKIENFQELVNRVRMGE